MTAVLKALLNRPGLGAVFGAVAQNGDEAWLVGGCVRNALLGAPISDLDVATQALPEQVMERAQAAGLKAIPTGLEHGTITVVSDGVPIEVTTLRRDVETDGRRAVVAFTRALDEDAARRDFTMNALYLGRDGVLSDPVGGMADLEARRVRFIGDASDRIREDYLRTLRYFRFYGWYGHGSPDRDAIKAIVANKAGLAKLSVERVWSELKKTLAAPHVTRSLLWMRQTGVYQAVLPESGHMDGFARFMRMEEATGVHADPLLRLMALLPPGNGERARELADRLKLSNAEHDRLVDAMQVSGQLDTLAIDSPQALRAAVYEHGERVVRDLLILQASDGLDVNPELPLPGGYADRVARHWNLADTWTKPNLPVTGKDLLARGIQAGPTLGEALKIMEGAWVASDFEMTREHLLDVLKT
ncbi:MAG: CCA tRNA nucleotidyltransferase [Devosiaceae bacterium]